jgi:predicted Zn finger-like uncharacterized protein
MSAGMVTRCPHCRTAFRISEAQLARRDGTVRCGACGGVFDARLSLTLRAGRPAERTVAAPVPPPVAAGGESVPPLDALAGPDSLAPPVARGGLGMGLAAAALALVLLVQGLYWFRSPLAGWQPELVPLLRSLCEPVGCTVELPRRPEALVIESSDLRADSGMLLLSATLHNKSALMLSLPVLELTVTDAREEPLARRRFEPAAYEPGGSARAGLPGGRLQGIAAGATLEVSLAIDGQSLPANGYRLEALYP